VTTTELERRVAVALKQHAEVAMSGTKTDQAKLERLLTDAEGGRKHRREWVAGAVAAAAAVVAVIVWAMGLSSGKPDSISPVPAHPLQPEQVATAYVNAYGNYDRPRLKSLLAGDALVNWSALDESNRGDEAIEVRVLPDSCTELNRLSVGTQVWCAFDVHALGSDRLGLGPYSNNRFLVTVDGGKIIESNIHFDYMNNNFNIQMMEPFMAWVTKHYPKDVPAMFEPDGPRTPATTAELFHQHIADYVAAKS